MCLLGKPTFKVILLIVFCSLKVTSITTDNDKQRIPLYVDKENNYFCLGEIDISEHTCKYDILGQQIIIMPKDDCKIVFTCNSSTLSASCCFAFFTGAKEFVAKKDRLLVYRTNETDVTKAGITEDLRVTNKNQMISIKLDATAKLLLLLVIILLTILLSSIIFCKIYCIKRMLIANPSSYNVIDKKIIQAKDTDVNNVKANKTQDLINLSQHEPGSKGAESAADLKGISIEVPLMV